MERIRRISFQAVWRLLPVFFRAEGEGGGNERGDLRRVRSGEWSDQHGFEFGLEEG